MSDSATLPTAEHYRYLAERTTPEDEFLAGLRARATEAGIPAISIGPAQASMMQILLKAAGARDAVEIGTLGGYSAIAMARALGPEGRVRTVELSPMHADFAERMVAESDVAGRVEVLRGSGADVLPTLGDASADAMFLDADKPGYAGYLEHGLRILRPRGLMMVDNAFAFGHLFDEASEDPDVHAIREFNDRMHAEAGVHGIIVPLGDGFWAGVKE